MSGNVNIRNCKKEIEKQIELLNDETIVTIFIKRCEASRGGYLSKCGGNCGSQISSNISDSVELVKLFRSSLWVPGENGYKPDSIRDHRNCILINELFKMKDETSGRINFKLGVSSNFIPVCKDFYRKATGFGRRAFNKIFHFVMNYDNDDRLDKSLTNTLKKMV